MLKHLFVYLYIQVLHLAQVFSQDSVFLYFTLVLLLDLFEVLSESSLLLLDLSQQVFHYLLELLTLPNLVERLLFQEPGKHRRHSIILEVEISVAQELKALLGQQKPQFLLLLSLQRLVSLHIELYVLYKGLDLLDAFSLFIIMTQRLY